MGRGKVELQRIDNGARGNDSFCKRRTGLLKKARELAVLSDAEVAAIVFSPSGKLFSFSSSTSVNITFERYQRFLDAELKVKSRVTKKKTTIIKASNIKLHDKVNGLEKEGGNEEDKPYLNVNESTATMLWARSLTLQTSS